MPRPFELEAVVFDFDGTLTAPGAIDFPGLREALGCPPGTYVLEYARSLSGDARVRAEAILGRFELEAAARSVPNSGAEEAVTWLHSRGIRVGVVTRNALATVERSLANFRRLSLADFEVVVTRDDEISPKPDPEALLHAAARLGVAPARVMIVGDFEFDIEAGRRAGAITAYLPEDEHAPSYDADFTIGSLHELSGVVRLGLPLPLGKLPNEYLDLYLAGRPAARDPSVIVGPSVGEDVVAVDVAGRDVLVAHPDPITLARGDLARYSVVVNANDIATSGGEPRWFLSTVLLPPGTTPSQALALLDGIANACDEADVVLAGGHTEVTDAVARPVVSGAMLGIVERAGLRDKRGIARGDRIVFTKGVAVEGTALLAREMGEALRRLGMSDEELARSADLLGRMSVLPEARIARGFDGVRAMHDVTEGGLATALVELSSAGGRRISVDRARIPVLPETERICELLGGDPLGLIGSGSLLIACAATQCDMLLSALVEAGIQAADIGEVGKEGVGIDAFDDGRPTEWPAFDVDEAARLLA